MLKPLKKQSKKRLLLKIRLKRFLRKEMWQHCIVVAFLFVIAGLFNKCCETILFCISHCVIRAKFSKQFHFGKISYCLVLTLTVIWIGVSLTLPITMSLLSTVPVSFLISYIGYLCQDRADMYALKNSVAQKEADFVLKCREARLSKRDQIIAYKYFIEKQKPKEIWLWLCEQKEYEYIEWDSVKQLLWRLGKRLK